jgi:hypothetical protein
VPVQLVVGTGLLMVGRSLFQGDAGWLAGGVLIVLLAHIGLVALRRRVQGSTGGD